jgi:hypothetical protein
MSCRLDIWGERGITLVINELRFLLCRNDKPHELESISEFKEKTLRLYSVVIDVFI